MATAQARAVRLRHSVLHEPAPHAVVLYIVAAPLANVLSTVIGSLSEYRFPHAQLATELHLCISLVTLLAISIFARHLVNYIRPNAPLNLHQNLIYLSHQYDVRESLGTLARWSECTPNLILPPLMVVIASLFEIKSSTIAEPLYWSFARLLPILLTVITTFLLPHASLPNITATLRNGKTIKAILVFLILCAGPNVMLAASGAAWVHGFLYAVVITIWTITLRVALTTNQDSLKKEAVPRNSPTLIIPTHMLFTIIFLLPFTILSGEIGRALRSGHLGFFTEPGFWIQESILAWCGLVNLILFWNLIQNLNPISVLMLVGIKDSFMPHVYYHLLGNPWSSPRKTALTPTKQWMLLFGLALFSLIEYVDSLGTTPRTNGSDKEK